MFDFGVLNTKRLRLANTKPAEAGPRSYCIINLIKKKCRNIYLHRIILFQTCTKKISYYFFIDTNNLNYECLNAIKQKKLTLLIYIYTRVPNFSSLVTTLQKLHNLIFF